MTSHILIVDDDADAREILARIVRFVGMEVDIAEDGEVALKMIQSQPPALVMLDLMMPHMDGFSVLAVMRSQPATRRIPVIVVTACARDQLDMLRLPGVAGVVQKGSFSVEDLGGMIRSRIVNDSAANLYATPANNYLL